MEINLIDSNIRHIPSFNGYDTPKHIKWCRDTVIRPLAVYSDHYIGGINPNPDIKQIAWLMEPAAIDSTPYKAIKGVHQHYDYIISHDLELLKLFSGKKGVFCPGSGSSLYSHEWKIYPKSKMVLTLIGNKNQTIGHKFRHKVAKILGDKIHIVGRGSIPFPPEKKAEILAPYYYQICIHNNLTADYWSDILIDCFATGTIPIVWGGKFLKKYFDPGGIICFDTIDELEGILDRLTMDDYISALPSVELNYKIAFEKYRVAEDYLYETFFKQFDESTADLS